MCRLGDIMASLVNYRYMSCSGPAMLSRQQVVARLADKRFSEPLQHAMSGTLGTAPALSACAAIKKELGGTEHAIS